MFTTDRSEIVQGHFRAARQSKILAERLLNIRTSLIQLRKFAGVGNLGHNARKWTCDEKIILCGCLFHTSLVQGKFSPNESTAIGDDTATAADAEDYPSKILGDVTSSAVHQTYWLLGGNGS